MNLHLPQSVEAATELREIAAVPKQLISPRLSKPLVSIVQDTLVGVNRLTRPTEFFTRREFMNLLIHSKRWDGRIPPPIKTDPVPLWSGQQVVSALLPAIYLAMGNKVWDEAKGKGDPNYVIINNGTITQGILDGDIFDKALVHILYNDFSPEMTVDFIDSLQAVVATYLQNSGFSVGLSDLIADSETLDTIAGDMNTLKKQIESLQLQVHMGLFDNASGRTNQEEFESKVFQTLDKVIGAAGKTGLRSLAVNNRMVNMVKCGSKGADLNIAQMIALLGQQSIEGKRIAYGFQDRTLPHFKRYDDGAEARGFIESSFVKGLSPAEFFFHAMTGREGLIDTAVKSVTGDTEIRIVENGVVKFVRIGDWIDGHLATYAGSVEHFPAEANLELLQLRDSTWIHTCDSKGSISATKVTAVTRHDPGDTLYSITTAAGRFVIVTAAKALIVYNTETGTYDEKPTADVVIGDILPAIGTLSDSTVQQDPIVSITPIDVRPGTPGAALYPKMYDITVPSTLNFALANGLVVRDTADSGYMQRQLVKTMEDLMTYHDGTVRDAGGLVVQFAYGDDATSATKIENQPIGLAKMNDTEIRTKFSVEDVAADRSQAHLAQIFADRDMLVNNVWNGKAEKSVQSAVHLPRLIANAVVQLALQPGAGTPVRGAHVLDTITTILQRTRPDNRLWGALLRYHLNPRDLVALGFTQPAFDWLAEQIVVKHMKSWVAPGEMAGIIAAQSLGEPSTQMSVITATWVSVKNLKDTSQSFTGQVGTFIDKLMTAKSKNVQTSGDSSVLNIEPEWAIMGVSNDEKTSWKPISQVSRHPANGSLVKVTTRSGRQTTATLSHSFLKRTTNGIAEIKGSDLRVGHRIPVAFRQPTPDDALKTYRGYALTKEFGWLVGIYLADGSFNGNAVRITKIHPVVEERIRALAPTYGWRISVKHYQGAYGPGKDTNIHSPELKATLMDLCNTGSYDKCLSTTIFHANRDFIRGLLSGYFDGDGNVNPARHQIRVCSRSKQLIRDIARLLPVCGVFGTLCEERSVRIPDAVMYTLNVIRKHAAIFQKEIGFCLHEKAAGLQEIITYNMRDAKNLREDIDMIPELGDVIAHTGRLLNMPGQSRNYGRYGSDRVTKKTAIGRRTLESYIQEFKYTIAERPVSDEAGPGICRDDCGCPIMNNHKEVQQNMAILESAAASDVIWDEITSLEILEDPNELVYDFTVPGNDSFMVDDSIFVHNTLNSVDWDTEILIAKDGKIVAPRIGEFIDNYLASCDERRIQRLPNDQLYVALDDGHDWKAVSCDEKGQMMWTKLEAITKHPVVNEDGTDTILEVTTESGRTVKATKGRSFLKLAASNIFLPSYGSDLQIGDLLPIANSLAIHELEQVMELDLMPILPPMEWLHGTEVAKAMAAIKTADATGKRHWFLDANGKDFTVPYARSDSFRDAFANGKNMHAANIKEGFVYPKKLWTKLTQIPAKIPLDREFGFFCGAYISEGSTSPTQIQITNNDDAFLAPIRALLDKWEIGHHTVNVDKVIQNTGIKGHTQSLIIHSTLLTKVMKETFGKISYEKTLPDWVLQAPDEFVKGLVDGYISGDGHVAKGGHIGLSSVSEALITRFASLLSRYGIFGTFSSIMPPLKQFKTVSRQYMFSILNAYVRIFAKIFTLTIQHKQERLTELGEKTGRACKWDHVRDMMCDKVVSIKECVPKGGKVYDLTVEKTRNFLALNGLACADTFHLAGVAAKSGMTRGVPRLKELLKATQNPKATSLTIYLRPDLRKSKEEARRLAQELEFTMLRDLVTVSRIYYDPRDSATLVAEDSEWLSFFAAFEQSAPEDSSPWIIRLELDRAKMFNKNITMEDISFVLNRAGPVHLTYTDHNASQMIFRIRLVNPTGPAPLDDLALVKQTQNRLLTQTLVRGLPGLRSVTFRKTSDEFYVKNPDNDNKYEPDDQFVLDTFGTNFLDTMIHPDIDGLRLVSNHVHDMYENLGIEAARAILFREIFGLFEQAAPVNYRHVAILCDAMCNRGRLMSADRYGVNKKKTGPLAKASFEQTEDIMLRAALFGEMDPVTGVSANIMTGQPIRGGTSFTQVLLDEAALQEYMATSPRKTMITAPVLGQEPAEEAPGCRQADLHIQAALPPGEPTIAGASLPDLEIMLVDE